MLLRIYKGHTIDDTVSNLASWPLAVLRYRGFQTIISKC